MSTGPGYLDSNNIWQYGEDDAETLMSDLLNKGLEGFVNWTTWALAPIGITIGTGGLASSSQRFKNFGGGLYLFRCKYVLGTSGAAISTAPRIRLPFNVVRPTQRYAPLTGSVGMFDVSSNGTGYGVLRQFELTANEVLLSHENGGAIANITPTVPFTWAAGDELSAEFWAEALTV
jgi:hypothetical protein